MRQLPLFVILLVSASFFGCKECKTSSDCSPGEQCRDNHCYGGVLGMPTETDTNDELEDDSIGLDSPLYDDDSTDSGLPAGDTVGDTSSIYPGTDDPAGTDTESTVVVDTASEDVSGWDDTEERNGISPILSASSLWISFDGGTFEMGAAHIEAATPVHTVTLDAFDMMRSEVTAQHYRECVLEGGCDAPGYPPDVDYGLRTYNVLAYRFKPVNFVDWEQAKAFCEWIGGYLPSEAQWEFAARSEGADLMYPWGDQEPDCHRGGYAWCETGEYDLDRQRLLFDVCQLDAGWTYQNMCDMSGNVWEWTADMWHDDYVGAPETGEPWVEHGWDERAIRGAGRTTTIDDITMHVAYRQNITPSAQFYDLGFRCARDPETN